MSLWASLVVSQYDTGSEKSSSLYSLSSKRLLYVCLGGLFMLLIKIGLTMVPPDSCEQPLKLFLKLEVRTPCWLAWYADGVFR